METVDAAKHDHCSFATIINKPLHFALFSGEGKKWILGRKHKDLTDFSLKSEEEQKVKIEVMWKGYDGIYLPSSS